MFPTQDSNHQAALAAFGLLGAVKAIAADRYNLGPDSALRHLRVALERCEAQLRAINHPLAD